MAGRSLIVLLGGAFAGIVGIVMGQGFYERFISTAARDRRLEHAKAEARKLLDLD
jgi:hypothetical protein